METLGIAILVVGAIISMIGGLMFLVAVFRESVVWGLVLFIPIVGSIAALIFLFSHWDVAKKPFLISILGNAVAFGGVFAMGSGGFMGAMGLDAGTQGPSASFESDLGGLESIGAEDNVPGETPGDDWTATAVEPEAEPSFPDDGAGGLADDGGGFGDGGELADVAGEPADTADPADTFGFLPSDRGTPSRPPEPSRTLTPRQPRSTRLTVESAGDYVGQRVRIVKKNGKVLTGRLIGADELRLTIEERMGGGTMSYPVRKSDVEKIELVGRR